MKRLTNLRKQMNMSQSDLADRLEVSQQTISKYENGTREPDHEMLLKMSKLFNVSIDYLLGNSDIKTPKTETSHASDKVIPEEFTDPDEAREYIGMHAIFGSEGFRLDTMNDEEVLRFANELLRQMELISYKYKK